MHFTQLCLTLLAEVGNEHEDIGSIIMLVLGISLFAWTGYQLSVGAVYLRNGWSHFSGNEWVYWEHNPVRFVFGIAIHIVVACLFTFMGVWLATIAFG